MGSIDSFLSNPTGTELAPRQLTQSANRNTVESNNKEQQQKKSPMNEKERTDP